MNTTPEQRDRIAYHSACLAAVIATGPTDGMTPVEMKSHTTLSQKAVDLLLEVLVAAEVVVEADGRYTIDPNSSAAVAAIGYFLTSTKDEPQSIN